VATFTTVSGGGGDAQPRICSNDELAEYALLVAVGPAQTPLCVPTPEQSLWAPEVYAKREGGAHPAESGLVAVESQVHGHVLATGDLHFAHLHVIQSDAVWCKLPCDAPSWELAAPKPKKGSPYLLLEAAIWRQFRKVTLYQFDAEWEEKARNSYQQLCGGRAWGCAAYENHRESRAVVSVGPWPAELDMDGPRLSAYIKDAFQKVFAELHKKAGDSNAKVGLTYSGHGGDADGSLFAGVVDPPESISLLKSLVEAGGKFSIFNFGTNCEEARWNMLAAMHPFADWIIASDLNVGGLEGGGNPAEDMKHIRAKEKLGDVAVLKRTMEARQTPKEAVAEIVAAKHKLWNGAMKDAITKQKLRQSGSAFVASKFAAFAAALKSTYQNMPRGQQEELVKKAEYSGCDVLVVARFMDSAGAALKLAAAASSFVQHKDRMLLRKVSGIAAGPLETLFKGFRVEYASTRSLFAWDPVTHGLGFNYRGAWNRGGKIVPRCDLKSALGEAAA